MEIELFLYIYIYIYFHYMTSSVNLTYIIIKG